MMIRRSIGYIVIALAPAAMLSSCGLHRKDQTALVPQNIQQPDRILYTKAVADIQQSRFERARLTLQTLINTYDTSALLSQAKFAIADSWYREGGPHGLAQAEAELNDLLTQFPNSPSASEARQLIRKIQEARAPKEFSATK